MNLFSVPTLLIVTVIYVVLVVVDILKRGFLSKLPVWAGFMLTFPWIIAVCLITGGEKILQALDCKIESVLNFAVTLILILAILLLTAILYIRGHIKPVDRNSPKFKYLSEERLRYAKVKRLVIVGTVGTVIYLGVFLAVLVSLGELLFAGGSVTVVFMLLMLTVPLINLFAFIYFFALGVGFLAAGCTFIVFILANLLVANGCIRCIVKSDMTKVKKVLLVLLSFVPAFNVIYGFVCIRKMSASLKTQS